MPAIDTVGVGKTFALLQLWEDVADGQPIGTGLWAECYSGGDLGKASLSNWVAVPTSANYARVYVADGEGHGGDSSVGAYIDLGIGVNGYAITTDKLDYLHVDGLRNIIDPDLGAGAQGGLNIANSDDSKYHTFVDNCIWNGIGGSSCIHMAGNWNGPLEVQNCVLDGGRRGLYLEQTWNGNALVYNCTIYGQWQAGVRSQGSSTNTQLRNCLFMSATNEVASGATNTYTTSIQDIASNAGDYVTDAGAEDFSLIEAAITAINQGTDYSSRYTKDIAGVTRPQGDDYDIGAFEFPVAVGGVLARRPAISIANQIGL